MSIVTVVVKKLFGLLFGILGIFKKLACFLNLKRGRKNSGTILPMHAETVSHSVPQSVPSNEVSFPVICLMIVLLVIIYYWLSSIIILLFAQTWDCSVLLKCCYHFNHFFLPLQGPELESWDNNWVDDGTANAAANTSAAAAAAAANRRPAYMNKPVFLSNKPEPEPEPDVDYFEDMTPQIKKAAKVKLIIVNSIHWFFMAALVYCQLPYPKSFMQ